MSSLLASTALAGGRTYTFDADFSLGLLENLNYTSVHNQLQVNLIGVGSKYIFVANHNEDSVSKFDTTDQLGGGGVIVAPGKEVARYKTFASPIGGSNGGHPSRIAIDVDGNAYVLNRMDGYGTPPYLIKVLVDTAIDRNGNGLIDSSGETNGTAGIQPAEMMPLAGNTNASLMDERVAWIQPIGSDTSFGRSICIAPDGKLWVGIWNQARYYRVDPATGATLPIPGSNAPYVQLSNWNPYGCTVDKNGMLWSATLYSNLGVVNTNTGTSTVVGNPYSGYNYGIAQGNSKVYQAPYAGGYGWAAYNPAAGTWTRSPDSYSGAGIAIDGEGNILSTDYSNIRKYNGATGALMWAKFEGGTTYGVMVDGNNDVWVMNTGTNRTTKYRSADGALVGFLPTGAFPYVYTDGSGLTTKNNTVNKLGTWTVVHDGGAAGSAWGKINWTESVPTGASIEVQARASDNAATLDLQAYVPVANNGNFMGTGRYIQVRTRLQMNAGNESPILYDLTINGAMTVCDVDANGSIDLNDINLIRAAIGMTPTANDPREATGDGKITINDVRACTLKCTRASCAVPPPVN
ncbi:hypothetical protein [Pelomonas sp. SE-A7]|uniref:Vgb family protein n=1 Tax=Pelomonas sp. SE-A7 TaxID=3054953 RepID=UPI00259CA1E9|nr:hypothetical protein [Pelomonas sp. SE-A7]MDM4766636.1 hypothetical protein [Pelomonas sp. SE-A7]